MSTHSAPLRTQPKQPLLDLGEAPVPLGATVSRSLPPAWVDIAEEAREDLNAMRLSLMQLQQAQKRRLLHVFCSDGKLDKYVEDLSHELSELTRRCETKIGKVAKSGAVGTGREQETHKNASRHLAAQLQELSHLIRNTQKEYSANLSKINRDDAMINRHSSTDASAHCTTSGLNNQQLLELEQMEEGVAQRSDEICQIASSVTELNTIFKEMAVVVIDQGTVLDRIDYNIEEASHNASEARRQLDVTEKLHKARSNRSLKCIVTLSIINFVLMILLMLKYRG